MEWWKSRPSRAPSPESGFTLLEVLIATSILAIVLTSVFGSLYVGLRSRAHAKEQLHIAAERHQVFESLTDDIGNALQTLTDPGLEDPSLVLLCSTAEGAKVVRWRLSGPNLERSELKVPDDFGRVPPVSEWNTMPMDELSVSFPHCREFVVSPPAEDGSRSVSVLLEGELGGLWTVRPSSARGAP